MHKTMRIASSESRPSREPASVVLRRWWCEAVLYRYGFGLLERLLLERLFLARLFLERLLVTVGRA